VERPVPGAVLWFANFCQPPLLWLKEVAGPFDRDCVACGAALLRAKLPALCVLFPIAPRFPGLPVANFCQPAFA